MMADDEGDAADDDDEGDEAGAPVPVVTPVGES